MRGSISGRFRRLGALAQAFLVGGVVASCDAGAPGEGAGALTVPAGFAVAEYATVPGARSLALGGQGTIFVGTRDNGHVWAVRDEDGDGRGERVIAIASGLDSPNGVAVRDGDLYVAENSVVSRYQDIEAQLDNPPVRVVVRDDFPTERAHGWKFIAFGPEGKLYVPVGAPCNSCLSENPIYASITRMNPDGSGREVVAHGVRNTVGFDWHPETSVLWFTDNGRDRLGDDVPPDELNRAPQPGLHFGYPFVHGRNIQDPEYYARRPHDLEPTVPVQELGPHVAALGMRFYRGSMFPAAYRGQIFIAEHGSWNRSQKIGYRVMLVRLEGDRAVSYEPFATGWLQGERVWGRPVDLLVLPDGSLLVSDDHGGKLWRITYSGGDQ
jgi:glucose/arabinose dehydrogenase